MTGRLAYAYGLHHAAAGSAVLTVVGLLLGNQVLGVTRQPLPLVWVVAVLQVTVAMMPLREILPPLEWVALRAPLARGIRAAASLLLVLMALALYVWPRQEPAFVGLVLWLTTAGLVAGVLSRRDPWITTLGLGLGLVGLEFVTPLGPLSRYLAEVPLSLGVLALAAAGVFFTWAPFTLYRRAAVADDVA